MDNVNLPRMRKHPSLSTHSYSCASLGTIAHHARTNPRSPALIEPEGITLSYEELWALIETLSERLEEADIGAGERVAILLPQGAQEVLAVAGVLNRHIAIPLQPRTTTAEVVTCLRRLSVSALITAPEFEAEAEAAMGLGMLVLVARRGAYPKEWQIRVPAFRFNPHNGPSDAIVFNVTSATTGDSKIVPRTAANLDAMIAAMCNYAQLTSSDRQLLMIPQAFGIALPYAHAQFSVGGTVIATGGFNPASYLNWLDDLRPTWYVCAPAVHQAMLAELRCKPPAQPVSLRFIQSGFAPLPEELRKELEQILGVPMLASYGATEAGDIASEPIASRFHVPNCVGRSSGLEIGIMNSSGLLLPPGEEGEIAVRGLTVASGYVDNPEATRAAFRDGWYRTGDAGCLDADGNLYLKGRLKEIINRGGEKIAPAEVDAVLLTHPAVMDAAAFALPHRTLGEDVACAVVLRSGDGPWVSGMELRRFAVHRLPKFKVPHRIFFVDQIPRGELGKPQRWLLAEQFKERRSHAPAPEEVTIRRLDWDTDDVFYKLHEIWARLLERNDLGLDEDFFDAGGDSLGALRMLIEVDERFGSQTLAAAASFIDEPTLENLTGLVGTARPTRPITGSSELQVFPVREGSAGRCIFCVPSNEEEGLYFRRMATHLLGQMDLSIVRPANTLYSEGLFTFERAGEEMAELLRQTQLQGPYFVAGFCYGGIVAFEAARRLALGGQEVRLLFFDVPTPGRPSILDYCRNWSKRRSGNARIDPEGSHPFATVGGSVQRRLRLTWSGGIAGFLLRRMAWSAVVSTRRLLVPIENVPVIQQFLRWALRDHLPFYRPRTIDVPILHFLCTDEPRANEGAARFGWNKFARRGIDEQFVPLDHSNILHESNLPRIVETLLKWCYDPSHQ